MREAGRERERERGRVKKGEAMDDLLGNRERRQKRGKGEGETSRKAIQHERKGMKWRNKSTNRN